MRLTHTHKPKRQDLEELIQLSCRTHLAWINNNIHDVKYLAAELCRRNGLTYSLSIGALCAHVAKHYSPDIMRCRYSDLATAEKLINRFRIIFEGAEEGCGEGEHMLDSMEKLVEYGRACLLLTMKSDFKSSITHPKQFDERLRAIIRRWLASLLLQFIPGGYSDLVLKLYLEDPQTTEERAWMQENRHKYEDISPYHDFFQIISSLSHHILYTRRALNWQHYLDILTNPAAGSVEWPMVLGVRNLHRLPYLQ